MWDRRDTMFLILVMLEMTSVVLATGVLMGWWH